MKFLRILLADDHTLVRAGLSSLIERLGHRVVGEARDGQEVLHLVSELCPDIVLMDIAMPGMNGLDATAQIQQLHPGVRVIILSMHATVQYAHRAIQSGASGYLLKDSSAPELASALQAVSNGKTYLSPRITEIIESKYIKVKSDLEPLFDRLTHRQREVLQLIGEGRSRSEIAAWLNISAKTVDTHRAHIMQQLEVHSSADLYRIASKLFFLSNNSTND